MEEKIVLTKDKFEILGYYKYKGVEDSVRFNFFGQIMSLYENEIIQLYEFLMKNRNKNED